jgi:hypothetical protein
MITPEMLQAIKESKANHKVLVIKDFYKDTPSWQEFMDYIDKSSKVEKPMSDAPNEYDQSLCAVIIGNVIVKQNFYYYLGMDWHMNKATEEIEKAFNNVFNAVGGLSSIYLNVSSNVRNVEQHTDELDNFYWQCIGSTTWHCEDNSYIVNPGDMVYIPSKTYHGVDFSMPRAAIGFSWILD